MKIFVLLFSLCLTLNAYSIVIKSINVGLWSESSTWDLNRLPVSTDTVYVETFVHFDLDFTNSSPSYLHITDCGALCGQHTYTGRYIIYGIVNIKRINLIFGASNSYPNEDWTTQINLSEAMSISNPGTSMHNNLVGVCIGLSCMSTCEGDEILNKKVDCISSNELLINEIIVPFFPNPSTGYIFINDKIKSFEIQDTNGQKVANELNFNSFIPHSGVYFLKYSLANKLFTKKIVIL